MGHPASSSLSDQRGRIVRQLKLLVIVLALSNLGLGAFSFHLLRKTDDRYSELIERSVPVLNNLLELTARSVEAMHATNPNAFGTHGAGRPDGIRRRRAALERDQELRERLLKHEGVSASAVAREELRVAGEAFSGAAARVLDLLANGKDAEATVSREQLLRPAFDRYLMAATKMADVLEANSLRANSQLTHQTDSLSAIILGVGSWPVIVMAAILVLMLGFVVVLMVIFGRREANDGP